MKRTAPAAILLATGLIAGCSSSEPLTQKADFQSVAPSKADATAFALEVPPDLSTPQTQNKYTVPASGVVSAKQASAQQPAATPAATATAAASASTAALPTDQVKMVRDGNQRWLVVGNKSEAELWPLLKAFWQDSGFTIKSEEPDSGIMETDWAENRAKLPNDGIRKLIEYVGLDTIYSTSERDMFRIRLEKGENGATEVYFAHHGMEEVYTDQSNTETRWQPRATDPALEAEMLARFMTRLGTSTEQARAAIKKTEAPVVAQAAPITSGSLNINDSFDRTWRRVGLALDRIGLVVTDRDRAQGIYFVNPAKNDVDKVETPGFWSSLWGSKAASAPTGDSGMRILIKETAPGSTTISLLDKQGQPLNNRLANDSLTKLQQELQ